MSNSLQKQTKIRLSEHLKLTKRYEKNKQKTTKPNYRQHKILS